MKKVLCFFALLFIMVGLCSCDDLPTNEPTGSETTAGDNNGGSNSGGTTDEETVTLGIPANLKYDYETGMLSWDSVKDATSYIVSANGNEFASDENSTYLPIVAETTRIKVKAKHASATSDWTNEIIYNVDENDDFNNLKLFVLGELKSNTELLEIVSYNIYSPLVIICRVKIEGEEKLVRLAYSIPSNSHSALPLRNIINLVDKEASHAYEIFDIIEYDTFKKLMDDNLLTHINNYKDSGYEVECLGAYATRYNVYNGLAKFYVHSNIQLTKDNQKRYYSMNITINSEIGEGSAPYMENLATARISPAYHSVNGDVVEKMIYEAENDMASYGLNTTITDSEISRFDSDPEQISAPTNLNYNPSTGMLSWNSKGSVKAFIISANGKEYTTSEHSMYLPISASITTIKVKAQNDEYTSDWSTEITHTVTEDDDFNNLKLFVLGELKSDTKLLDIVHYNKTSYQGSYSFIIHCRVEIAGEIKFVRLEYSLTQSASSYASITDILELIDEDKAPLYYIYGAVEYDSLEAIIDNNLSNPFTASINNGYEVEYLTSYTTQYFYINGQPRFFVYAIAKLTKDTEVKHYGVRIIVKSDAGEGSQAYIENLSTATISSSVYLLSNDIVEKILLEAENNATAIGTNITITDADISRYDDVEKITEPTNLKYDNETGMLSWNSNGLVDTFIISANGKEYITAEHSMYLPISASTTTIKVKAQNDEYTSDWSTEITHTVTEDDDFNNLKLFVLGELKSDTELLEIMSYSFSNIITIICRVKINNIEKIVRLAYSVNSGSSDGTIAGAISLINRQGSCAYEIFSPVEYDSLQTILDNNLNEPFASEKSSGYEVEYLYSYTTKYFISNEQARFYIYALAKLVQDDEVIYKSLRLLVKTTEGEGSETYIENLSTATFSRSLTVMSNDVIEKMLYEAESNITASGTNTTIIDDDITIY